MKTIALYAVALVLIGLAPGFFLGLVVGHRDPPAPMPSWTAPRETPREAEMGLPEPQPQNIEQPQPQPQQPETIYQPTPQQPRTYAPAPRVYIVEPVPATKPRPITPRYCPYPGGCKS